MNQVQNQAPATQTAKHLVDNVLHTLVEVGSMWAVHGLRIGKMALTTSAETLGKTAAVLDTMAVELQKKHPPTSKRSPCWFYVAAMSFRFQSKGRMDGHLVLR